MTPSTRSSSRSGNNIRSPFLWERTTFLFGKQQQDDNNDEIEEKVEVGTKEYYHGFLSSPRYSSRTTKQQHKEVMDWNKRYN
mmetsp:Transcript_49898/g.56468  ORF Transcript_49898/g.56468 Transcript_49898/m.56468 type:complete len:82 (-) Transcript_49898:1191-1436(-)